MRNQTACFSGHRKIPIEQYDAIYERLNAAIENLLDRGYRFFGTGGALGFDTMAAQAVLAMRKRYSFIRLILVLPCLSQAKSWNKYDRTVYEYVKVQADKVVYISREYTRDCMHRRNRHLVNNSSVCICYLTETSGGTAYTVNYARKLGLEIINIA